VTAREREEREGSIVGGVREGSNKKELFEIA